VDRLRTWGRNPWLVVGTVLGVLLVFAWIGWGIHVWSDHGARQGLGALLAWAVIAAIVAAIVAFILAVYFLLSPREADEDAAGAERASTPAPKADASAGEKPEREGADSEDTESEPEAEAAAS
jgi:uncharacterized membrane protein